MASVKYGQTWWGQQWLKSLDHIDYDNRLPRGRTYANKGAVREVKIDGNTITARVQGSRPRPYQITIKVPPFDATERRRLVERVSQNPVLISRLLNRELDPAILLIAESLGIKVFPSRWDDFDMNCSCPDWAVPCKHLAAVIYKVCSEIDNDPFLVFRLHQLDLVKALKDKNIVIGEQAQTRFLTVAEVLKADGPLPAGEQVLSEERVERAFEQLNYSAVDNILEPLVRILPDAPPFYTLGNFRELYEKCLKRVAKTVRDVFSGRADFLLDPGYYPYRKKQAPAEFRLQFGDALSLSCDEEYHFTLCCSGKEITPKQLTGALYQLSPAQLPDFDASVAALYQLQLLALNLLQQGAVVPQIFFTARKEYLVRWQPAVLDKHVRALLQQAEGGLPAQLLLYQEGKKTRACGEVAVQLCSFF